MLSRLFQWAFYVTTGDVWSQVQRDIGVRPTLRWVATGRDEDWARTRSDFYEAVMEGMREGLRQSRGKEEWKSRGKEEWKAHQEVRRDVQPVSHVGSGISRHVFALGSRHVLKVPRIDRWRRFLWGLLANMQEADYGGRGWPELCPVTFAVPGGFAVVARRAAVCTEATWPGYAEAQYVVARANEDGRCVPAELKPSSWGWLDGRLVAVDYG